MRDLRQMLEPERERLFAAHRSGRGYRYSDDGTITLKLTNAEAREILGAPARRRDADAGREIHEARCEVEERRTLTFGTCPWEYVGSEERAGWAEVQEALERRLAAVVAAYFERKIGVLMRQADHWLTEGKPLAVHHRVTKSNAYYQIVSLMQRFAQHGENPFETMRQDLAGPEHDTPGAYPPNAAVHAFRDPCHAAREFMATATMSSQTVRAAEIAAQTVYALHQPGGETDPHRRSVAIQNAVIDALNTILRERRLTAAGADQGSPS